jgi:hypothetical protein
MPIGTFNAHASPVGMVFYHHPRFPGLAGNLLVMTYKPNFSGQIDEGRTLFRVKLTAAGNTFTTAITPLVTNFDRISTGLDLTVSPDGEVFLVEFASIPIQAERVLKLSHPFLKLTGSGQIGTVQELTTFGKAGDFHLTMLGRPATNSIPVPPYGVFEIDPGLVLVLDTGVLPASDALPRQVPVPNDPALRGARLMFQSLVVDGTQPQLAFLTNGTTLTIQ